MLKISKRVVSKRTSKYAIFSAKNDATYNTLQNKCDNCEVKYKKVRLFSNRYRENELKLKTLILRENLSHAFIRI